MGSVKNIRVPLPGLLVMTSAMEPWASVTFSGSRHCFTCAIGLVLDGIEEAEFALPGHFVADINAQTKDDRVTIEALTIEDA